MGESDFPTVISHPSFGWVGLPDMNNSGTVWISQVLRHFSLHMSRLTNTGKSSRISPLRFFCVGFRFPENVAICFLSSNDAKTASGICVSPVTYAVLCVRFVSFVRFCRSRNRQQRSAGNATLDTGGWLNLMKLIQ